MTCRRRWLATAPLLVSVVLGACGNDDAPAVFPDATFATQPEASPLDPTSTSSSAATTPDATTDADTDTTDTTDAAPPSTPLVSTVPVEPVQPAVPLGDPAIGLVPIGSFEQPVDLAWRRGDTTAYIVERVGRITPLRDGSAGTPVLDITDLTEGEGERGLLGLTFNGDGSRAYVNHTDNSGDTVIAEYSVAADGTFDPASRRVLLTIDQPYANHNGGNITIGPDGMLYIGMGDGGDGGDPQRFSLNVSSLLGKILRIDPAPSGGSPYTVPADNPFTGGVVMKEGLSWAWETFPEFMDTLAASPHDIDIAVLAPHSPARVYVMGERGANREVATRNDLAGMSDVIREAVEVGALGFATSRTAIDRRNDGKYIASFDASETELIAAAQAVKDAGGGLIQMIPELGMTGLTPDQEFALMRAVSQKVGLPITFTMVPGRNRNRHFWHELLRLSQEHNREGGALIHPQYFPRPVGMLASFELTSNPFVNTPAYKALAHLPLAERVTELRKPEVRARILADDPDEALLPLTAMTRQYDVMFELGEPPCYEPEPGSSITERAALEGRPAPEVAYDLLLENDGKGMLYVAFGNWPGETLDHLFKFFDDPNAVMGLGDGGAHYGLICDSSYPTFVLSHWARDRKGRKLSIEQAVRAMTSHPAGIIGLNDRGVIAPGYKANINVIDHDSLTLHAPEIVDDLPGGGRRLDQRASGYRYMLVSGEIVTRDDQPTGVLPGKLVRGKQSAPAELVTA